MNVQLQARMTAARSHMAYEAKGMISKLYGLDSKTPRRRKELVEYLLQSDRFTCHPTKRDVRALPTFYCNNPLTSQPRSLGFDLRHLRYLSLYMPNTSPESARLG